MDLADPSALETALIFLVPGFVSLKVWDLLVPSERREFTAASLDVFAYSALNFAILVGPLIAVGALGPRPAGHPVLEYFAALSVLFIAPALWPVAVFKVLKTGWLKRFGVAHPIPKPWDYVFGAAAGYWVILHMKDGRRIGGRYDVRSENLYALELFSGDGEAEQ